MFRTLLSVKRLHFVSLLNLFSLLADLLVHVLIILPLMSVVNPYLHLICCIFTTGLFATGISNFLFLL